jgi:hypothetical protein
MIELRRQWGQMLPCAPAAVAARQTSNDAAKHLVVARR